jgi:hypothetical protein
MNKRQMMVKLSKQRKVAENNLAFVSTFDGRLSIPVTNTVFLGKVSRKQRGYYIYVPITAARNAGLEDGETREVAIK